MSSLLRRQLLRSESHYNEELAQHLMDDLDSSGDEAEASLAAENGLRHAETAPLPAVREPDSAPEHTASTEPLTPTTPSARPPASGKVGMEKERRHGTTWKATAAVLLADMFGLGTLTLPADYARLGWVVGLAVTVLSAAGLIFSGLLFTRLSLLVPRAQTFADYGDAAFGRRGRRVVYLCVYTCIALEPVILQLICTQNLQQILHHFGVSQLVAGVAIAAFMVPLSQIQTLEEITWLAYAGTVGMLVGVVIVFGKLVALPPKTHHMAPVNTAHPRAAVTAFLDIVFTFGGQVNWVRYVSGMKRRGDFKYSAAFAGVFMTVIYITLGLYGYFILGSDFDFEQPVSSIFKSDVWIILMNLGILVHCIIAYQINLNVWTDMVLHLFVNDLETREERSSSRGRRIWAIVTTLGIIYSLTLSQLVPYFSLVMAIIAAIGDLTAAYALPALFCIKLSGSRLPLPRLQAVVCYVIIPVSIALSGVGLASSLTDLYQKLAHRFHH